MTTAEVVAAWVESLRKQAVWDIGGRIYVYPLDTDRLTRDVGALVEALQWYATTDYDRRECDDGDGHVDVWGAEDVLADGGARARNALAPFTTTETR